MPPGEPPEEWPPLWPDAPPVPAAPAPRGATFWAPGGDGAPVRRRSSSDASGDGSAGPLRGSDTSGTLGDGLLEVEDTRRLSTPLSYDPRLSLLLTTATSEPSDGGLAALRSGPARPPPGDLVSVLVGDLEPRPTPSTVDDDHDAACDAAFCGVVVGDA